MALQAPSELLVELLRLERERKEILSLAQAWAIENQDIEELMTDKIQKAIKEASSSPL